MKNYLLTVYCLAYNHEKYIEKTLQGFVLQKTKYPFKVIVHDDASTDGTADIIRQYAERYPDIIFPIFQSENQYSKGIDIFKKYIIPEIEGKYIAVCEGDDYWSDLDKIEIQLDYMENHPECSMCVHNTEMIKENGEKRGILFNHDDADRFYSTENIIEAGGGGLFHTSSFLCRKEVKMYIPEAFSIDRVGDYPWAIYASVCGKVYFINRVMSVYRTGSQGSWVSKSNANREKAILHYIGLKKGLLSMNKYTKNKYKKSFFKMIDIADYYIFLNERKVNIIFGNKKYRTIFLKRSIKQKVKDIRTLLQKK